MYLVHPTWCSKTQSTRILSLLLLTAMLLCICGIAAAAGTLKITIIDVGQGDATLVQSPSGKTLLFDGGKSGRGTSIILPYLQSEGLSSLDYVVASHYHADHVGGLDEVINGITINEAVLDRGWSYTTATYTTYANAAGSKRQSLSAGQVIDLGEGVTATCVALNGNGQVSSPYDDSGLENEYDVCLLVEYGEFDFFQAGDLTGGGLSGSEDIETSVASVIGDIDVYRVSHHGSQTSSNANFLQGTTAETALISVGGNSYGHPAQTVLDRLVSYGSYVYQTEPGSGGTLPSTDLTVVNGHIELTTDGISHYYIAGDQWEIDEISAVDEDGLPPVLALQGNVPNPFNPATNIVFAARNSGPARLEVFDLMGRQVHSRSFTVNIGQNSVFWNGSDNSNRPVSGGIYMYSISMPEGTATSKMLLLK